MKNKKIKLISISIFVFIVLSVVLTSCRQTSFDFGAVLETDGSGHFLEDVDYTFRTSFNWDSDNYNVLGKTVDSYSSDGLYKSSQYIYEGANQDFNDNGVNAEGYIILKEVESTYSFDNVKMLLKRGKESIVYYYSDSSGSNEYNANGLNYTSEWESMERTAYLSEHNIEEAFLKDGDSWISTWRYFRSDGAAWMYITSATFSSSLFGYHRQVFDPDNTNTLDHLDEEYQISSTITEEIPSDTEFSPGSVKRWNGLIVLVRQRFWDGSALSAWENDYSDVGSYDSIEFLHMGDFIVLKDEVVSFERTIK